MFKFLTNLFLFRSGKWETLRCSFIKENPYCIACGTNKKLQVHHIESVHTNSKRELDKTNLCTLCETCHFVFGHLHNFKKINPSIIEDAVNHMQRIKDNSLNM